MIEARLARLARALEAIASSIRNTTTGPRFDLEPRPPVESVHRAWARQLDTVAAELQREAKPPWHQGARCQCGKHLLPAGWSLVSEATGTERDGSRFHSRGGCTP